MSNDDLHISLKAETLFHLGPIPVTNSMMMMFVVMVALLLVGAWLARKVQSEPVPGRAAGAAETIVEMLMNLVESTAGKRVGRKVLPLVAGLFLFIIIANFTGLLPGVGTIFVEKPGHEVVVTDTAAIAEETPAEQEEHQAPALFRPPTADLNMTVAMATVTFIAVQIAGVAAHGVGGRIKHMANPPFLFPLEVISELSRIISLSARLFGNIFAGEVLLGVMYAMSAAIKIALLPFLFPVVFIGIEVLFGTIQALVFALLTLIYIYLAAAGGPDDDHDEVRAVEDRAPDAGATPAPAGD